MTLFKTVFALFGRTTTMMASRTCLWSAAQAQLKTSFTTTTGTARSAGFSPTSLPPTPGPRGQYAPRGAALAIDAGTLWLFDTYLKGQTPPFPTNPEIINLYQK
jgi:hypothetical protein